MPILIIHCKLYLVETRTMQKIFFKSVLALFDQNWILKTVPFTSLQNHENPKTQSFIACKVPSILGCIILWYCANNPLFYWLIVRKAADFIACLCQGLCSSSICLLPLPFTWILEGKESQISFAKGAFVGMGFSHFVSPSWGKMLCSKGCS